LFSDEIYEIVEDDLGYFWMSSRKGIFRVSKKDLDALDRGEVNHVTSVAFGKADGLLSVQCNGVAKPAGWKDHEGRIWFATIHGVVAVEPGIETNHKPPPVLIEEVVANQRLIAGGLGAAAPQSLTVSPGSGELEIHFTALSFQAPEKNRFKYKLAGVDSSWIDSGAARAAHYYNLAPGHYDFQVIGCNNDGVWNEAGATLAFVFEPHFWQTWWFKFTIGGTLALILLALYRYRVARLREIENLRIQIAADLHDDVGARLTKVAMVSEQADREISDTDRVKPHIRNISSTTREIVQAMDEIVWTINPKNDTLENLANYIFQYAQDYFQHSGVRCRLDLPARLPELPLSTAERHNLFMAVKEALNNVIKHAGATEVRISLAVTDTKLTITIIDNGRGFVPDAPHAAGNGLDNMKQRLERIGGRLRLESKPGDGTTVRMEANGK
jgi:signal transduction histidine kinase